MAARKPTAAAGSAARKPRDKGTRGGRPEPQATLPRTRPGGNGRARTRTGASPQRQARKAPQREVEAVPAAETEWRGTPLWLQITTWVLAAGGLGMSVYLTIAHFNQSVSLVCPATTHFNCEKVTTSPQSYVFGIPVAVLGLAFYLFMFAATSPWAWRATWQPLRLARLGSIVVGIGFVLYLIYCELFPLHMTICLLCTTVHVITFALFVLILFAAASGYGTVTGPGARPEPAPGRPGLLSPSTWRRPGTRG